MDDDGVAVPDETTSAGPVREAVSLFHASVLADAELAGWFAGIDMDRLRAHQRAFITLALGGRDLYSGRDLSTAHAGREITQAAFDLTISHLGDALREVGMDPGVVASLLARIERSRSQIVMVPEAG